MQTTEAENQLDVLELLIMSLKEYSNNVCA